MGLLPTFLKQSCCQFYEGLVENARKFRESASNQILIFGEPPPRVGASENVWFVKIKRVYRAGRAFH